MVRRSAQACTLVPMSALARRLDAYEVTMAAVLQPYRATRPPSPPASGLWDALARTLQPEEPLAPIVDLALHRRLRRG